MGVSYHELYGLLCITDMKKVVLIRLPSYYNVVTPPLGIGYLLKALTGIDGIEPVFIDGHRDRIDEDELIGILKSLNPLLVGFHVFSVDYSLFRRIVPRVRQACPNSKIIAGGPHVSGLPQRTLLDNPDLDFAVSGEGEEALPQVVQGLLDSTLEENIADIPNLVHRSANRITLNPIRFVDVNKYGAPAWDKLEPNTYPPVQHGTFHKSNRLAPILTSRGCPYPCTYCAGHLITGKRIRLREVCDVADEIELLQSSYGIEEFIIEDENFTFYKERVLAFADEIRARNLRCFFSFPNGVRPDRLDAECIHALKQMGTYMVGLGIESGSPGILKSVQKEWNFQQVRETIGLLKAENIIVSGFFIFGFPGETRKDMDDTLQLALNLDLDLAYFGNYIPLPGSDDFNRLIDNGEMKWETIDWNDYTTNLGRIPYHPRDISSKELLNFVRRATIRFYGRPRILFYFLRRIMRPVLLKSLVFRVFRLFIPYRSH